MIFFLSSLFFSFRMNLLHLIPLTLSRGQRSIPFPNSTAKSFLKINWYRFLSQALSYNIWRRAESERERFIPMGSLACKGQFLLELTNSSNISVSKPGFNVSSQGKTNRKPWKQIIWVFPFNSKLSLYFCHAAGPQVTHFLLWLP